MFKTPPLACNKESSPKTSSEAVTATGARPKTLNNASVSREADTGVSTQTATTLPAKQKIGEFVPPSGKLAALTRKENEIFELINNHTNNKNILLNHMKELDQKYDILYNACFNQELNERGMVEQQNWWGNRSNEVVRKKIMMINYLKTLEMEQLSRSPPSSIGKSSVRSTVSVKIKLAEKKAKLVAEKVYNEQISKLEKEKHQRELDNMRALRDAEVSKLEIEHAVLESELTKLDLLADTLDPIKAPSFKTYSSSSESLQDTITVIPENRNLSHKNYKIEPKLYEVLKRQTEISEKMVKHQEKAELPNRQIPVFDGSDPTVYKSFITNFDRTIHDKCQYASDALYYLDQYTSGSANKLVNSCITIQNSDLAYQKARRLLHEEFGNEFKTATVFLEKLEKWPAIKSEDGKALYELSIFLITCENVLENITGMNQLNSPKEIMAVIMKLPYELRKKWRSRTLTMMENEISVDFSQLVKFVNTEAKALNQPMFGMIKDEVKDKQKDLKKDMKPYYKKNLVTKTNLVENSENEMKMCYCCKKSNHYIDNCYFFKDQTYDNKIEILKKNLLCFSCLKPGHSSRACTEKKICNVCKRNHPTILHRSTVNENNKITKNMKINESKPENLDKSCATKQTKIKKIMCAVVPIKVRVAGKKELVTTYAALDTCSSSSFVDSKLLHNLGVDGIHGKITLNTMESSDSTLHTKIINNLQLYDMDENLKDCIPVVYAQENWPFDKDDVPQRSDVAPHLKNLPFHFVDAEVGILIGMDRVDMLKPLQVVNGPAKTAYATLHHLGWALCGPVGECNTDKYINNRINIKDREEVDKQIKQMYLNDYNDSHVSKYEMSIDDKKWHNIMINSVTNIDDKYEIDLPLKENIKLLDNKMQAYYTFQALKKRLINSEALFEDYKEFMEMMLARGFMEKVPEDKQHEQAFYLTHHAVYHKEKKKIRIVFNCSLKYKGLCLNNALYQGPDNTNNLLGVLLRFREDKVAVLADIEKMFYMVKVTPECRKYLRFYWLKDSCLAGKPELYQLTVHLFGATSSPSVAGFALRQTVVDNPHFSEEVKKAVNRNFYVYDFLYSCNNINDAIHMIENVRKLVSKGGFNLTGFVTNSSQVNQIIKKKDLTDHMKIKDPNTNKDRVLGLVWNTEEDTLSFKININSNTVTKRRILSTIYSIYDPLGLSGPAIIPAKRIFQRACELNIGWDQQLPTELTTSWMNWHNDLNLLKSYCIKRCCKPDYTKRTEIHYFCDGSEIAHGAVAYIRYVASVRVTPRTSKNRVTPCTRKNIYKKRNNRNYKSSP